MGVMVSYFASWFGNKEVRVTTQSFVRDFGFQVLILGLDNAGKTTILYKLYAPDRVIRTMPTIGSIFFPYFR